MQIEIGLIRGCSVVRAHASEGSQADMLNKSTCQTARFSASQNQAELSQLHEGQTLLCTIVSRLPTRRACRLIARLPGKNPSQNRTLSLRRRSDILSELCRAKCFYRQQKLSQEGGTESCKLSEPTSGVEDRVVAVPITGLLHVPPV